jgi:hypothetical protein
MGRKNDGRPSSKPAGVLARRLRDALRHDALLLGRQRALHLGVYPIATFQYGSTTSYQVSYHIQQLFF